MLLLPDSEAAGEGCAVGGENDPRAQAAFTLDHPLYASDEFRMYCFK